VHGYEQDKIIISLLPLVTTQYPQTRGGLLVINFIIFHYHERYTLTLYVPSSKLNNRPCQQLSPCSFSQNVTERVKLP